MRRFIVCFLVLLSLPIVASAQREKLPLRDLETVESKWPNAYRTSTGLWTEVLQQGNGIQPERGDVVHVLYKGWLLDGTQFDQAQDRNKPFSFRLDRGRVIAGWEYGLLLMREGEKRVIIVPHEMGYGTRGRSPDIPRQATLVFEVELIRVEKNPPAGNY